MLRFFIGMSFLFFLCHCGEQPLLSALPATPVEVVREPTRKLADLGFYERAVALETTDASLIGGIQSIKLDPRTGDLLVGDFRATQAILRFNPEGRFLQRYGRVGQGPGEYEAIHGFAPLANGRIVALGSFKLLLWEADGSLVTEQPLRMAATWVEARGEDIYVRVIRGPEAGGFAVFRLNGDLKKLARFHPRDPRLDRVAYVPYNAMTLGGRHLYLSECYDFRLTAYDLAGKLTGSWVFPSRNERVVPLLQKAGKLTAQERNLLFRGIHRPRAIYAFSEILYLWEVKTDEGLMNSCLFEPGANRFTVYENLKLVGSDPEEADLTMTDLVGRYDRGLIGYCEDPALLRKHAADHPVLADLKVGENDNPVVLFFRLKSVVATEKHTDGKGDI